MEPMFFKDVEQHPADNNYTRAIDMMKRVGPEYPQILHMFSFKMHAVCVWSASRGDHAGTGAALARHSRAHRGLHLEPEPVSVLNEVSRRGGAAESLGSHDLVAAVLPIRKPRRSRIQKKFCSDSSARSIAIPSLFSRRISKPCMRQGIPMRRSITPSQSALC